jgi:hypothetical protein
MKRLGILLILISFTITLPTAYSSYASNVGCLFTKSGFGRIFQQYTLEMGRAGENPKFLKVKPDLSTAVELFNDKEEKPIELMKGDYIIALSGDGLEGLSIGVGEVSETFKAESIDMVKMGFWDNSNNTKVNYKSFTYGKMAVGLYLVEDSLRATCQILQ